MKPFTKAQQNAPHRFAAMAFLILAMGFISQLSGSVATLFISPAGAGTQDGLSCTNAKPKSFFDNGANWGSGAAQIGPDSVVMGCAGTYNGVNYTTPGFLFQGSGTAGHPITFRAMPGFILTSPVWGAQGNGGIVVFAQSHIVIDGGGTGTGSGLFGAGAPANGGIIRNTANGWDLANHADSNLIYTNGNDVVVQNWNLQNTCVVVATNSQGCESSGVTDAAIYVDGASQVTITHNSINDTMAAIFEAVGASSSGNSYTLNQTWNMNWGVAVGAAGGANHGNGGVISFNDIRDAANWDGPGEHHNGVFLFTGNGGTLGATTPYLINSEYIHGDFGVSDTSMIFNDPNGAGASVTSQIVNNLLVSTTNAPANAYITGATNGSVVADNTIVHQGADNPSTSQGCMASNFGSTNAKYYNNLCVGARYGFFLQGGATLNVDDFNLFFSLIGVGGKIMITNGGTTGYTSVAAWTAATGYDAHSQISNPNLTGTFQPGPGSAAIGTGTNLTFLGIPALNVDRNGAPRPATGAWTIGAFNSSAATAVVSIVPSPVNFPATTQFVTSSPTSVAISNAGGASLVLGPNPFSVSGTNGTDFVLGASDCINVTIAPGGICHVAVTFTPKTVGPTETAVLSVTSNAAPAQVTLNGSVTQPGTAAVSVTPNPLTFPDQVQGTTGGSMSVTVKNTGTADLNLANPNAITITGTEFVRVAGGCADGATLHSGDTCPVTANFTPSATGLRTATLTVHGNATGSATLRGNGTAPTAAAFTITPTSFNFGNQRKGTTGALHNFSIASVGGSPLVMSSTSFFTISGGTNPGDFGRVSPGGTDCIPGHSYASGDPACTVSLAFTASTAGPETATLSINANVPGPTAALSGTGIFPALTITPAAPINFGSVNQASTSPAIVITVRNSGTDTYHFASTAVTIAGDFSISAKTCNDLGSIAVNATCTISATFTPTAGGTRTGVLTLHGDVNATVDLTGTGVATSPVIIITPRPVQFPGVFVGATSTAVATVTNTGTATETFSGSLTTVTGSEFTVVAGGTCNGGGTLAPTLNCTINLSFTPIGTGLRTGTLTVNGTVGNTVALNGNGVPVSPSPAPVPVAFF